MLKYSIHQDKNGKWYVEDFSFENLGSILYYPKEGTLVACTTLIEEHYYFSDGKHKIKKCSCGGEADWYVNSDDDYFVECDDCGREGPHRTDRFIAIAQWNELN